MTICAVINGKRHCYDIPVLQLPIKIPIPHPPENYDFLFVDATIVNLISELATQVTEPRVVEAINVAVQSSIKAMQAHAGPGVEIHLTSSRLGVAGLQAGAGRAGTNPSA